MFRIYVFIQKMQLCDMNANTFLLNILGVCFVWWGGCSRGREAKVQGALNTPRYQENGSKRSWWTWGRSHSNHADLYGSAPVSACHQGMLLCRNAGNQLSYRLTVLGESLKNWLVHRLHKCWLSPLFCCLAWITCIPQLHSQK